ncbi:ATP-binding protein [Lichenifustis flavocetrariae]|uniref:histidine kinase n=1 Tax=Lichenifustis flavocetrariae TaxID=2949735 RepID=A0AA41Z328_9HYPH|nr:ATP-binding protein [Lichenifustis flavocetrariae]MCW6512086.1 ATP-binding protein [Lichenifustis flavocetrariae]
MTALEEATSRVLILAPIGRDGPASAEVLRRAGMSVEICRDLVDLVARIQVGAAAVFVAEEALVGKDLSPLIAWVEGQPPWSDLPFVMLTSRQARPPLLAWRQATVRTLRNVSLLERPVQALNLTSMVSAAVRSRIRQYEVRVFLRAQSHAAEALEARVVERTKALAAANSALRDEMAERERVEESLRQSQKMEAIGQLTGGVAHDFNNLLTVIRSSVDLLKRPDLAEERRRRYVEAISDTTTRASKLTSQLLAFARRQSLKPEVFGVLNSVHTVADMVAPLTGSRIAIDKRLPDAACFINADPSQFDTSLINLAVNARDAMDGEGRLTIIVEPASRIPAARAHPEVWGAFVAVSVSDTGSGIASGDLERIFEPFFTTKSVGQGTGLGLSQVFGFAKQSGGSVAVESEVGRGTTFTLYLPSVKEPAVETDAAPVPAPLVAGHGTSVLLVEDNADVGAFSVQALQELGYRTTLACDAAQALSVLELTADAFDIMFSDVMMPGMNGIELGQKVRRLHPDLPVVLTSGYSQVLAQDGSHGFELLHKPYSIEDLSRVLQKAAEGSRAKPTRTA